MLPATFDPALLGRRLLNCFRIARWIARRLVRKTLPIALVAANEEDRADGLVYL